jgi:AcrR family transcriptional regulator
MRTTGPDTKERIERTALRLFVERGVAETSIKEIAKEAGVSQGAMYNHYSSKDELAWTLFATNFSEIGGEFRRIAYGFDTLEPRIRGIIKYCFRLFEEDWVLMTYVFLARHSFLKKVTPEMGNPYMVLRTIIAEAMRRGEIKRSDPELATSMVLGAVIQVIDTRILGRIRSNLMRLADDVADACIRQLKA